MADETPTATAKTEANTKHMSVRGSEKAVVKNNFTPFLYIKNRVRNKNREDSAQDKRAMGELTSQRKGRKKVAVIPPKTISIGLEVLIVK